MNMSDLKQRIKQQETPLFRMLYRVAMGMRSFSVPVIRPLHSLLYRELFARRSLWHAFWRIFYYEPMFKSRCREVGSGFRMEYAGNGCARIVGDLQVYLGANVTMFDRASLCGLGGFAKPELRVGSNTYLDPAIQIMVAKSVTIGGWCVIACRFISDNSGHPITDVMARMEPGGGRASASSVKPVVVGDFCFLGKGSVVYPGTTVGDGVVAQLDTHLKGVVPPFTLVAGNPMRILGKLPIPEELRDIVGDERYRSYLKAHDNLDLESGEKA